MLPSKNSRSGRGSSPPPAHRLGRVGVELLGMGNDRLATLVTIALRELIASASALEGKDADMTVALERARREAERIGAEPVPS